MKINEIKTHHRVFLAASAAAITGLLLLVSTKLTALDFASGAGASIGAGTSLSEILALMLIAISFVLFGVAWHLAGKHV